MVLLAPVFLLWLQLQFGALRVLERLPRPWGTASLVLVWTASAVLLWALLARRLRPRWRALGTPWPTVALAVLVAAVGLFVYPEVDGRRATGAGSDADDAVLLVVDRLWDGEDPFAEDTYLGNPPTTGPGSALWASAFPTRRAYAVSIAVALAATLLVLRRWTGGWEVPSLTALLAGGSVPFWEGVAQGNDHLTMGCGVALVAVATGVLVRARTPSFAHTGALAAGAAVVATWRAAYLYLPALLAVALWRRSPRAAAVVGVGGTVVALVLHAALLSRTAGWDAYDPVQQLLVKTDEDLTAGGRAALVAAGVVALAGVAVEARRRPHPRPEVLVLAGLGGPLAAIAVAGAVTADEPAAWSEAGYLLPTLLLASVVTARWVLQSRPG